MPIQFRDSAILQGARRSSGGGARYANVRLEGYEQLQRKLNLDTMIGRPWKSAWHKATKVLYENVRKWAPVGETGRTKGAVGYDVDYSRVPRWARVHMRYMPTKKGFRYGGALEGSRRIPYEYNKLHWRKGRLTRRWFSGAKGRTSRAIGKIFGQAGREIQAMWESLY